MSRILTLELRVKVPDSVRDEAAVKALLRSLHVGRAAVEAAGNDDPKNTEDAAASCIACLSLYVIRSRRQMV